MSWDVLLLNFGGKPPPPIEQLQEDDCQPIGTTDQVRHQLSTLIPGIEWSNSGSGVLCEDDFAIEFRLGSQEFVSQLMLHVRGGGEVITILARVVKGLGFSALDCSTMEFIDLEEDPSPAGWEGYKTLCENARELHFESEP